MGTLREKMLAELQLRGITPRTQTAYLREIAKLENYFNRSPEELGEEEVKEYLVHMLEDRGLSSGTYKYYAAGITFLYRITLNRGEVVEKIKYPKAKIKLPVVLDLSEVLRIPQDLKQQLKKESRHKGMNMSTYICGLLSGDINDIKRKKTGH